MQRNYQRSHVNCLNGLLKRNCSFAFYDSKKGFTIKTHSILLSCPGKKIKETSIRDIFTTYTQLMFIGVFVHERYLHVHTQEDGCFNGVLKKEKNPLDGAAHCSLLTDTVDSVEQNSIIVYKARKCLHDAEYKKLTIHSTKQEKQVMV
ncbi:hypothetical protein pdam_00024949 [Pocillopora damicornis]|uniref:Uncharacterized protein n=1 Tax=Pocillopora damicornis TaxID=46731 RepID=A0A3M6TME1_POCDA|nr:hypothetical protein pdam_00024949 [Pocillopora damicornis]